MVYGLKSLNNGEYLLKLIYVFFSVGVLIYILYISKAIDKFVSSNYYKFLIKQKYLKFLLIPFFSSIFISYFDNEIIKLNIPVIIIYINLLIFFIIIIKLFKEIRKVYI